MEDCSLNRSQVNELTGEFAAAGLDANEFAWVGITYEEDFSGGLGFVSSAKCTRFKHKVENFYFDFNTPGGSSYSPTFRPGRRQSIESAKNVDWRSLLVLFGAWLRKIKAELNEQDLWQELLKSTMGKSVNLTLPGTDFDDDHVLDKAQCEAFCSGLDHIEVELSELLAGQEQLRGKLDYIHQEFEFLKQECRKNRIGVIRRLVIGVAIQFAFSCATDRDVFEQIIKVVISVLSAIPNLKQLPS